MNRVAVHAPRLIQRQQTFQQTQSLIVADLIRHEGRQPFQFRLVAEDLLAIGRHQQPVQGLPAPIQDRQIALRRFHLDQFPQRPAAVRPLEQQATVARRQNGFHVLVAHGGRLFFDGQLKDQVALARFVQRLPHSGRDDDRGQQLAARRRIVFGRRQRDQPLDPALVDQRPDHVRMLHRALQHPRLLFRFGILAGKGQEPPQLLALDQLLDHRRHGDHPDDPLAPHPQLRFHPDQLQYQVQLVLIDQRRHRAPVLEQPRQHLAADVRRRFAIDHLDQHRQVVLFGQPLQHRLGEQHLGQHGTAPSHLLICARGVDQRFEPFELGEVLDRARIAHQVHQQGAADVGVRLQANQTPDPLEILPVGQCPQRGQSLRCVPVPELPDQRIDFLRYVGQDAKPEIVEDRLGPKPRLPVGSLHRLAQGRFGRQTRLPQPPGCLATNREFCSPQLADRLADCFLSDRRRRRQIGLFCARNGQC
jgi:hypothetical protein